MAHPVGTMLQANVDGLWRPFVVTAVLSNGEGSLSGLVGFDDRGARPTGQPGWFFYSNLTHDANEVVTGHRWREMQ